MDEDKCLDWLERMDIPVEAMATVEKLKDYLEREFPGYTDSQRDALVEAAGIEVSYSEHGIRGLTITYPWGVEHRYGIQGLPGLWGWEAVQTIREEEEW